MMSEHTPGPWVIHKSNAIGEVFSITDNSDNREMFANGICCIEEDDKTSDKEIEANARLISAAPELLEALKKVKEYINPYDTCKDCGCHCRYERCQAWYDIQNDLDKVNNAISKAEEIS